MRSWLKKCVIFVAMTGVAFVMLEGLASGALFSFRLVRSIWSPSSLAFLSRVNPERIYLEPDTLIGWRIIPGVEISDLWGPGTILTSSEQALRGRQIYDVNPPPNVTRIICSGDSFTLGFGVTDEDTWCAKLRRSDRQALNFGAVGYGIDQAYLRYERDAAAFIHHVHVFAVIPDGFRRMQLRTFIGYQRPYFVLENGDLALRNVPVPPTSSFAVWRTLNGGLFNELRLLELGQGALNRVGMGRQEPLKTSRVEGDPLALAEAILERVEATTTARGARLVILYLAESMADDRGRDWQVFLGQFAARHDAIFIDAYGDFADRLYADRRSLFSSRWGHYSVLGNEVVAGLVSAALDSAPAQEQ